MNYEGLSRTELLRYLHEYELLFDTYHRTNTIINEMFNRLLDKKMSACNIGLLAPIIKYRYYLN